MRRRVKHMRHDFGAQRVRPHLVHQWLMLSSPLCRRVSASARDGEEQSRERSSAYRRVWELGGEGKSESRMLKSRGLRGEP